MTYCTNCGHQNTGDSKYCSSCGQSLEAPAKNIDSKYGKPVDETSYYKPHHEPRYLEDIPKRNYLKYFSVSLLPLVILGAMVIRNTIVGTDFRLVFFSIVLAAVFSFIASGVYLYYTYHNFSDFNLMISKYHSGEYHTTQDPTMMLLVGFVFSPIMIYFKYQQLYDHLDKIHRSSETSPNPWIVLILPVILLLAIPFVALPILVASQLNFSIIIFMLLLGLAVLAFPYFEYQWQNTFNKHIQNHETNQFQNY